MGCSPPLVVSLVRDWDNFHLVLGPHLPPESTGCLLGGLAIGIRLPESVHNIPPCDWVAKRLKKIILWKIPPLMVAGTIFYGRWCALGACLTGNRESLVPGPEEWLASLWVVLEVFPVEISSILPWCLPNARTDSASHQEAAACQVAFAVRSRLKAKEQIFPGTTATPRLLIIRHQKSCS